MSSSPPPSGLVLTGERTLPGIADETYWFERHVVAYQVACEHLTGGDVLDAGCGEGYGLDILRRAGATRVIGVDLDHSTVAHAAAIYGDERTHVVRGELSRLPLADHVVDTTVSFQVIEHLYDIPGYLRHLRRVTRPGGFVLIATPNRLTFTPGSDTPTNPFHTREFSPAELRDELDAVELETVKMLGIRHGARLRAIERVRREPLTDTLTASTPDGWPRWVRAVTHRVNASWFEVREGELDTSLDLLAVCRVPR